MGVWGRGGVGGGRREAKASNKSETSKYIYIGVYMCNHNLKNAYYCVPLLKNSRNCVRFRWSENLYEFLCLCFGLGSAHFDKIIENSNCNFASHKYANDYLLGRNTSNGSLHRVIKHVSRHRNLFVTTSGFCNELEKICFDTSAGDRIFGAKNQLS